MIYSDKILVSLLQQGNSNAFKLLFERYHKKLFVFLLKFIPISDAEEIVQEVFVKVWEKREGLNEELSFSAYIYKIARNLLLNHMRKKTFIHCYNLELQSIDKISDTTTEQVYYNDIKNIIDNLVNELPEKRREIYLLSREKGLSNKEISTFLNISMNTVETQMRRSLQFLREKVRLFL